MMKKPNAMYAYIMVLLRDSRPFAQPRWSPDYWDKQARLWRDDDMKAFPIDTVALYWAEPDGATFELTWRRWNDDRPDELLSKRGVNV